MHAYEEIERPHEILGLSRDETDVTLILRAAQEKLEAIQAANGSELQVRRVTEILIVGAREQMLRNAASITDNDRTRPSRFAFLPLRERHEVPERLDHRRG